VTEAIQHIPTATARIANALARLLFFFIVISVRT
jgi:hypothetical protein